MSQISTEIGKQIRTFRKKRKMTLEALRLLSAKANLLFPSMKTGRFR